MRDKYGDYVFIIKTSDEEGFWWWCVNKGHITDYFNGAPVDADAFCNDIENSDKGMSCGEFKSVEDAENDILKF